MAKQTFGYSEENLDSWAREQLTSIFQGSTTAATATAQKGPIKFGDVKVTGTCWRAQRNAVKFVHFFELSLQAKFTLTQLIDDTDTTITGAVELTGVGPDDVEDDDYTVNVSVDEGASDAKAEKLSVRKLVKANIAAFMQLLIDETDARKVAAAQEKAPPAPVVVNNDDDDEV